MCSVTGLDQGDIDETAARAWEPTRDSAPGHLQKPTVHTESGVVWGWILQPEARVASSESFVGSKSLWQTVLDEGTKKELDSSVPKVKIQQGP